MTTKQRIEQYNKNNTVRITGIKKLTPEQLNAYCNGNTTLGDIYKTWSGEKDIVFHLTCRRLGGKVVGMSGNSMLFTMTVKLDNGDYILETKNNTYLLEV